MTVVVPTWFKGRQGKIEEVSPGVLKLSAPNLKEWYLALHRTTDGHWLAALRPGADASDAVTQSLDASRSEYEAWDAAFEVYRNHVVI